MMHEIFWTYDPLENKETILIVCPLRTTTSGEDANKQDSCNISIEFGYTLSFCRRHQIWMEAKTPQLYGLQKYHSHNIQQFQGLTNTTSNHVKSGKIAYRKNCWIKRQFPNMSSIWVHFVLQYMKWNEILSTESKQKHIQYSNHVKLGTIAYKNKENQHINLEQ